MPTRRPATDRAQLDLFGLMDQARSVAPALKDALSADLKACAYAREVVASRMALLSGREVTRNTIDLWCAPSHEQHRLPAELLPAWVRATEKHGALELLAEAAGCRLVVPGLLEQELADVEERERELTERKRTLRALVAVTRRGT